MEKIIILLTAILYMQVALWFAGVVYTWCLCRNYAITKNWQYVVIVFLWPIFIAKVHIHLEIEKLKVQGSRSIQTYTMD